MSRALIGAAVLLAIWTRAIGAGDAANVGAVSGAVIAPDGRPAARLEVELVAAADLRSPSLQRTTETDAGGRFLFADVAPGEYAVAVNRLRRIEPAVLYPTWFFPGTADRAAARVITVSEGRPVQLDAWRLPAPLPTRELTGIVVWPDGQPVGGAVVFLADGERANEQVTHTLRTERDGRFTFLVHDGLSYAVRAGHVIAAGPTSRQLHAIAGPFVPSPALPPVRLVMPER